jgi:hypothetical protein
VSLVEGQYTGGLEAGRDHDQRSVGDTNIHVYIPVDDAVRRRYVTGVEVDQLATSRFA